MLEQTKKKKTFKTKTVQDNDDLGENPLVRSRTKILWSNFYNASWMIENKAKRKKTNKPIELKKIKTLQ